MSALAIDSIDMLTRFAAEERAGQTTSSRVITEPLTAMPSRVKTPRRPQPRPAPKPAPQRGAASERPDLRVVVTREPTMMEVQITRLQALVQRERREA